MDLNNSKLDDLDNVKVNAYERTLTEAGSSVFHSQVMLSLFKQYLSMDINPISDQKFLPLSNQKIVRANELVTYNKPLTGVAMVKLNGGLGTSMGCKGPKSLISLGQNQDFLSICYDQLLIHRQKYRIDIPLVLMNSQATHSDTLKALPRFEDVYCFLQESAPRICRDGSLFEGFEDTERWYPPGHGQVFNALLNHSLLDELLNRGITTLFISNSDNVGAHFDADICNYFESSGHTIGMEVVSRLKTDVKGGVVGEINGRSALNELSQMSVTEDGEVQDFYFNTNSLWVNLELLRKQFPNKIIHLPMITNEKYINGHTVIQLESAMGSIIEQCITTFIHVDRSRFCPVKTTADLMRVQSMQVYQDSTLHNEPINIKLSHCYESVEHYHQLVKVPPKFKPKSSLEVIGPVIFQDKVEICGKVSITNHSSEPKILTKRFIENQELEID